MPFFTFTDASNETFVLRLLEAKDIRHARGLLNGAIESAPHIAGTVVETPEAYNIGWSYHVDPASMFFFELSTEVGDSTMRYIEDHLDEVGGALLPGSVWTGWSSRLVTELHSITGSRSADTLAGTGSGDIIFAKAGNDTVLGVAGDDHLIAAAGSDRAAGGQGDDKLSGGEGNDTLIGGSGSDVLDGGAGDDVMRGGGGPDRFLFGYGFGADQIQGFDRDMIDLRSFDFTDKSAVGKVIDGQDLLLEYDGIDSVRLLGYLRIHTAEDIDNAILI